MKLLAAALLAGAAVAVPTTNHPGPLCPSGLYSVAQCCDTLILGLASIGCATPSPQPDNGHDFKKVCAQTGRQAVCCVVPVAGQAILCVGMGADD